MATTKIQPDYGDAFQVFYENLKREAEKNQIPVIQDGVFTGQFNDARLPQQPDQPQPRRLMEHFQALQKQGVALTAGQPIPGFQVQDPYQSEGALDAIKNVMKLAYNRSLTADVSKGLGLGEGFEVEGFEPSKIEDISASVLSFFSPLDLIAMVGGGGVGGLAVKGIAKKAIAKAVAKGIAKEEAERTVARTLLQIIPRSAGSIGVYEGAREGVTEALDSGQLKLEPFLEGLVKGGALGALVGPAGTIGGRLLPKLGKPFQKALDLTAETVALGGASPFIFEGRAPKLEDFKHAAEFLVGLKLVNGTAGRAWNAWGRHREAKKEKAEADRQVEIERLNKELGDNPTEERFNEVVEKELQRVAGIELPKAEVSPKAEPVAPTKLPSERIRTGTADDPISAIKLKDGTIISDPTAVIHADVITNKGINPADVIDGGFLIDGKYRAGSADAAKIGEIASAKERLATKKAAFKPVAPEGKQPWEMTKAEQSAVVNGLHPQTLSLLNEAMSSGDVVFQSEKLQKVLRPDNKLSRSIFEERTGTKLPRTVKGTNEAIGEWQIKNTPGLFDKVRAEIASQYPDKLPGFDSRYPDLAPRVAPEGKGITPEAKQKFTKMVGSEKAERQLKAGGVVEMTGEKAGKILGEGVLQGKNPPKVLVVQGEGGGKAVIHELSKMKGGKGRSLLNLVSVENIGAAEKALAVAKERKEPLFIATGLKNTPVFRTLRESGLVGEIKEGQKYVRLKQPELTEVSRESFKKQMAEALPNTPKEQIEATMAIVDARAESAGLSTDAYLKQRFPAKAILSKPGSMFDFAKVQFLKDGKAVITAFKKADVASMAHELGHVFRRDLKGDELAVASKWAGAKDPLKWDTKAEENFARGFEKYLRDGQAPTPQLKTVFEKFKDWLTKIYNNLTKIGAPEISPEMRAIYDSLLTPKGKKAEPFKVEKSEIPKGMDDIGKTLFQTRMTAKKMGEVVLDRVEKTQKLLAPLRSVEKRVKSVEAKSLMKMMYESTYRWAQYARKNIQEMEAAGFLELKTQAQKDALPKRVEKGEEPAWRDWFDRRFDQLAKAGSKVKKVENYMTRMPIREKFQDLIQGLRDLRLRLGDDRDITEGKALTAINASPKIVKENLNHVLESGQIESAKKALAGIKMDVNRRALDYLIDKKNFKSIFDALKAIERTNKGSITTEPFWMKRRGLELLPEMYETDGAKILAMYADAHAKKLSELEVFGEGDTKALKILAQLEKVNPEEARIMREALSKHTGLYDLEHGLKGVARTASDAIMNFEVITKIASGFAPLLNTSQALISVYQLAGAMNMFKAGLRLIDPKERAKVAESGIFVGRSATEAYLRSLGYEGGGTGLLRKSAEFATKWSLFNWINRFNNYLAAATIEEAIPIWIRRAQGVGKRAVGHRRTLAELGVNWQKPLTDEVLKRAMFHFAENSQLFKNVLKEPLFFNDPRLRPLLLFKRFGIRQFGYIKDILYKEFKRGNYMPILRTVTAGYLGGAAMIWAQNQIKSLLSGEEFYREDDGFVTQFMDNVAVIGMFGIMGDMLRMDRLSQAPGQVRFALEPVVISDVEKLFEGFTTYLKEWETYGDGWLATKRNAHQVFDIFGSLPRYAAKQLRTPGQIEKAVSYRKGLEKKEIFNSLLDGNGERAGTRTAQWNQAHPDNPITMDEVNLKAIIEHLERLAETKAGALGEKKSKEFRQAFREEKVKVKERVRKELTPEQMREFRAKLLLLQNKYKKTY